MVLDATLGRLLGKVLLGGTDGKSIFVFMSLIAISVSFIFNRFAFRVFLHDLGVSLMVVTMVLSIFIFTVFFLAVRISAGFVFPLPVA